MIDLRKRKRDFSKRVTSMKVLYDFLNKENEKMFLDSLHKSSYKKFFKSYYVDIINIELYKHNVNYFHFTVVYKSGKKSIIVLPVKDLQKIKKNLKSLIIKQIKNKEGKHYGTTN